MSSLSKWKSLNCFVNYGFSLKVPYLLSPWKALFSSRHATCFSDTPNSTLGLCTGHTSIHPFPHLSYVSLIWFSNRKIFQRIHKFVRCLVYYAPRKECHAAHKGANNTQLYDSQSSHKYDSGSITIFLLLPK